VVPELSSSSEKCMVPELTSLQFKISFHSVKVSESSSTEKGFRKIYITEVASIFYTEMGSEGVLN
jgi:hypothetical protein